MQNIKEQLPVGFHQYHKNRFFNYQLNRWYSLGYTRLEDIREATALIKTFEDYREVFVRLGETAVGETDSGMLRSISVPLNF